MKTTLPRFILLLLLYMLSVGAACSLIWMEVTDQELSHPGPRRTRPGDQP